MIDFLLFFIEGFDIISFIQITGMPFLFIIAGYYFELRNRKILKEINRKFELVMRKFKINDMREIRRLHHEKVKKENRFSIFKKKKIKQLESK